MQNWYIRITEENRDELLKWWEDKVDLGDHGDYREPRINEYIMSENPEDNSYYWSQQDTDKYCLYWKKDYELITLEQFRKITNPTQVKTHPEKWYIIATKENFNELNAWRKTVASSNYKDFEINHSLLSKHPNDTSYYYGGSVDRLRLDSDFKDYQEITLEQFRQITNSPMSETTAIQISRNLLNEYYEASTNGQKAFLSEHFKLDGSTTVGAIRKLYDIACSEWKLKIKANHPDCFEPESKEFDFGKYVAKGSKCILKANAGEELGLGNDFIQVRVDKYSTHYHKGFYLSSEYNWELITDNKNEIVLVPTKK